MAQPEDLAALLSRCALRDRRAFALLYRLTSAKLFGVCLRILKSRGEAEDALQEAYVRIWRNAERYRPDIASPVTWMVAIARNHAIDRLRAAKPASVAIDEAGGISDDAPTPEQDALAASEGARLRVCMEELDGRHAAILRRAYFEGLSYSEVADEAGVPLNTVKTWIRRSLIRLRECLSR